MALPGKGNPFAKGLTEKPPTAGSSKKSFVRIPLSTGSSVNIPKKKQDVEIVAPDSGATSESDVTTNSEATTTLGGAATLEVTSKVDATSILDTSSKEVLASEATPIIEVAIESEATTTLEVTHVVEVTSKVESKSTSEATSNLEVPSQLEVTTYSEVTTKLDASRAIPINPALIIDRYTREPHFISTYLESADLSSRLSRVLKLVMRETIGWGKEWACLPQSLIITRTKIAKGHISAVVTELESKNILIVKRQPGGKSYYALNLTFFEPYMSEEESKFWKMPKQALTPQKEVTAKQVATVTSEVRGTSEKEVGRTPQLRGDPQSVISNDSNKLTSISRALNKDLKKELNKSLSQHIDFQNRWNSMPTKFAKREREIIKSLLERFPDDLNEIYNALAEIETTGQDYSGNDCLSPIGLIATSWPAIKKIRKTKKDQVEQSEGQSSVAESTDAEDLHEEVLLEVLKAFEAEYTDIEARKKVVKAYVGNYLKNIDAPHAIRSASQLWWDNEGSKLEKYSRIIQMQMEYSLRN